ncbi:MAG: NGG1p interacting factor NIF3, partial [Deltaproteobacteria bacterium]
MKLKDIFDMVVREGRAADPRSPQQIDALLARRRKAHEEAPQRVKDATDPETLLHPYDDSRVVHGDPDREVRRAMVGIDIDVGELLLIDRLNGQNREKIDLAIAHHPSGAGFAQLDEVMEMQTDILDGFGVPITVAEDLVCERRKEVKRRLHAANHYRTADAARLLDIPFLCMHTPADNHAATFLQNLFDGEKPASLAAILDILLSLEEYRIASRRQVPPQILLGTPHARPGKIFVDMTGGTEGPKDIADSLVTAGVGTIVGMHLSEEHFRKFQGKHINVVV